MILPFRGALSPVFAHRKLETKMKIICVKIINVLFLLRTDNRETLLFDDSQTSNKI